MNHYKFLIILMLICARATVSVCLASEEKPLTEKQKIEALIKKIEGLKEAAFIRNGSSYDAKSAAKFLRAKWRSKEKEIATADDFIEKAGSVSSTSGKPYVIRFKGGEEVECRKFLQEQLKALNRTKGSKNG